MLSEKEIARYNRHLILPGFGMPAQQKLKNAKVLVVGAGGLGCPALQYLTAAGVGEIGIVDFDNVEESNLQRQILFSVADIGKSKAETAAAKLSEQNPFVKFRVFKIRLTNKNALQLLKEFDVIVDGSDNFSTRYLVNDACVILDKPLVYGSIFKYQGQVAVFNFSNVSGEKGPTYRCLFPDLPASGSVPNCSEIGVLGVLPGIIGTLQATEAIKLITGIGELLSGKILMFDALSMNTQVMEISRKEQTYLSGPDAEFEFRNTDYDLMCGILPATNKIKSISCDEVQRLIENKTEIQFLDVREYDEFPVVEELAGIHIPLAEIGNHSDLISRENKVIVYCRSGMRSQQAIGLLEQKYHFQNLYNLEGGVLQWLHQFHLQKK